MNATCLYLFEPTEEKKEPIAPFGKMVAIGENRYLSSVVLKSQDGLTFVGSWNVDGSVNAVDVALYEEHFSSFKNEVDGTATGDKDIVNYQGCKQRFMQKNHIVNTLSEYPATSQPYIVTMERYKELDSAWPGWYWRFIVEFSDPHRVPTNRTVGIYDADWNYLYTIGELKWNDSGDVDDEGAPIYKWMGYCPPGRQTTEPEDIYYALLHGAKMEGKMLMESNVQKQRHNFWGEDE